ncbi:MAG: uroporphyrinogen-III synthase, partial [Bryobacteraceae bacterium]
AGAQQLAGVRIACLGPVTSTTVRMHGLEVSAEAEQASMDSLIEAVIAQK